MAPSFTFNGLEKPSSDNEELLELLHAEFQMPSAEWWAGANKAFKQLQMSLEISHSEEGFHSDEDDEEETEPEGINPMLARAAALPIVKLFRIGTHLLQVTPTNEPLVCVAFGTIDSTVYNDIFWEAVAKVNDELELDMVVYDVYKGLFSLSLGGYEFKILYRQCNELLRSYPDVVNAPHAFLKNPLNSCLDICDMIETLNADRKRTQTLNMEVVQLAYFYIRAWALSRGLTGIGDFGRPCLTPKEILAVLFDFLARNPALTVSECIKNFLQVFEIKYGTGPTILGATPYPENTSTSWVDLLTRLRKIPLRQILGYPHYIQVSVMFTCSGMRGGQWLSMVEERLSTIPKSGYYSIWPNRLRTEVKSTVDGPYEGYYVIGCVDPESISTVVDKWANRVTKDKHTVQEECFMTIKSLKSSDFDTIFRVCEQKWPRKPMPNPLEKDDKARSAVLELPIRTKIKKVNKDGKKGGKESDSVVQADDAHSKLRPASEVLNRLKYDPGLNIDQFVVGYVDRHTSKIQEKAAASWQRDTTHEEFIPEHRIQYFKKTEAGRPSEIVWDRRVRVDRIFKENLEHDTRGNTLEG